MKKFSGISRTRWAALAALVVLGALGASVSQVRLPLCHPGVFALFSQPGYRFFLPVAQR